MHSADDALPDHRERPGRADAGIVGRLGQMLGVSAAMIASMVDPETIVFSGRLGDSFDLMAPDIQAASTGFCSPSVRLTPLFPAALRPRCRLYGATVRQRRGVRLRLTQRWLRRWRSVVEGQCVESVGRIADGVQ